MTAFEAYEAAKKAYFEEYPKGLMQFRPHHDLLNPDFSERRHPFIYLLKANLPEGYNRDVDPDKIIDSLLEFDENLTKLCWEEHAERFEGKCALHLCERPVPLGWFYCDPCRAATMLDSQICKKMIEENKFPEQELREVQELAAQSPYTSYGDKK